MSALGNVLIVDDEESMRAGCLQALSDEGYRVQAAPNGVAGLALVQEESFDVVLLDVRMPGLDGMEVLKRLRTESPSTVVVVMTGYASVDSAVEAMREGAYDYLSKPFTPEILLSAVRRAMESKRLAMENLCLRLALKQRSGSDVVVGESPAMQNVNRLIARVAPTDATVLILGETGVGKEVVARRIHRESPRHDKPFISVDGATLVESLFESELFGHVRGAFTGAIETTVGKLELAHGGTLFLDEIGNITPDVQAKLLRFIQEREFCKVGGTRRIKVDVRIIAATNTDLLKAMRVGQFREDLFYRLSVVPIEIPPLRERRDDIRSLAQHFLRRFAPKRNPAVTGFSEEALRLLERHDWPGNVRELENTVERTLVLAEGPVIEVDDFTFFGAGASPLSHAPDGDGEAPPGGHLAEVEKREIDAALQRFEWQLGKAAEYLGINRKTLREKIKRFGLQPDEK
jgi:DNA-binding NtrC family response regulator